MDPFARRSGIVAALALVVALPASADPAPATASQEVVRGGVSLRVVARVEGRGLRLLIWAASNDGQTHALAGDPIDLSGTVECTRGENGSGHGWGEGHGGSDGWSTELELTSGQERLIYDRRVQKELAPFHRGCDAAVELRLGLIDGRDAPDATIAKVQWTRPQHGPDVVTVLPR